jgi:hypothetical protein
VDQERPLPGGGPQFENLWVKDRLIWSVGSSGFLHQVVDTYKRIEMSCKLPYSVVKHDSKENNVFTIYVLWTTALNNGLRHYGEDVTGSRVGSYKVTDNVQVYTSRCICFLAAGNDSCVTGCVRSNEHV